MAKRIPIDWKDAKAGDFIVGNGREWPLVQYAEGVFTQINTNGIGLPRVLSPRTMLEELGFTCEREVKEEPVVFEREVDHYNSEFGTLLLPLSQFPRYSKVWVSTREPLTFKEEE